jgi:CRP-like cAMP-binding protein
MLAEQFNAAVARANTYASIDNVSRLIWRAHGAGHLSDATAQTLAEALQARKAALAGRSPQGAQRRIHAAPKAIRPRSPDRERAIRRRRSVAASGAVPSKIAASFTLGELAVLSIIARQVQRQGRCGLPIDAIAAMAGVCRSTVQNALRAARRLDLVRVQERPRPGRKHLPNIVTITSPDWKSWLRLDDRVQKIEHHEKHYLTYEQNNALIRDKRGRTLASCDNMLLSHQNGAESQACRPGSRLTA